MATSRRYFSKVPGAKFIQPDGHEMQFHYGFFDFKPEDYPGIIEGHEKDSRTGKMKADVYQNELEMVVNQKGGNPLFFTMEQVQGLKNAPSPIPTLGPDGKPLQVAATSDMLAKQDQALRGGGGKVQESGEMNAGLVNISGGDPNASTIDHALRARVADFEKVASGDKVAAARAEAALRTAAASVSPK